LIDSFDKTDEALELLLDHGLFAKQHGEVENIVVVSDLEAVAVKDLLKQASIEFQETDDEDDEESFDEDVEFFDDEDLGDDEEDE